MIDYPSLSTRVIGQAEKTLKAILNRELAGTDLTEHQWMILTLAVTGGGPVKRDQFIREVAGTLKIGEAEARTHITEMVAAQRLEVAGEGAAVKATDAAQHLYGRIHAAVVEITHRLWGDLPAEDLATAGRILSIITGRANAELAR